MIIDDPVKAFKLEQARCTPYLPMLSFDIYSVCTDVVKTNFPNLDMPINIYFIEGATLASILKMEDTVEIFIHVLLNDQSTPIQVCKHIITHELIHLIVPNEIINGKDVAHTPAFWEHETQMVPEQSISSRWIWQNFLNCLRRDKKNECIFVKKNWKKAANMPRYSWEHCKSSQMPCGSDEGTL